MFDTMRAANGAGLAAPQIGVDLQLVIFGFEHNARYPEAEPVPRTVLLNPVIDAARARDRGGLGGLPVGARAARRGPAARAHPLSRRRPAGQPIEREAEGFHARVVQHECDHLIGRLYPTRMTDLTQVRLHERAVSGARRCRRRLIRPAARRRSGCETLLYARPVFVARNRSVQVEMSPACVAARPFQGACMKPQETQLARALVAWILLLAGCLGVAALARAHTDPDELPGRVGRVAQVDGRAWLRDDQPQGWVEAWRNQPITQGDRFSTERGARAQLGVGSTELRVAGDTEIAFERLDDERVVIRVERGSLALRLRSRDIVREVEVQAGDAWLRPQATGHYRIDRDAAVTTATVWRGSLRIETRDQRMDLDGGRSVELARDARGATIVTWGAVVQDEFSDWVARDEQRDGSHASTGHVSPEMTGVDELEHHGRWERHPEVGMVWMPMQVALDWAPYRHGRWTWSVRWGWTWVDDAPWGFTTSHYGRWLHWRDRWVWAPGAYIARPVYAPALVAWVGGSSPGVGVSIGIGIGAGATVGWYPLAPWDVYVPPFRHPHRYYDRVNQPHRRPGIPPRVPAGPVRYGNQGVPQSVTVVPADVLQRRQPVAPAVIARPAPPPHRAARPPRHAPDAAAPVQHVPGGAVPVPRRAERPMPPPPVMAAPGGAAPAPVVPVRPVRPAPGVSPVSPASPVAPVAPARPVAPAPSVAPAPPVSPAPPARAGGDVRRLPPQSPPAQAEPPRMRHTPAPPARAPSPPVRVAPPKEPRAEPPREVGRETPRDRGAGESPQRRDNARERAERQ